MPMRLVNMWLIVWFRSFGAINKTYYIVQLTKACIIAFIFSVFYHSLNILQTKCFLSIALKTLLFPYAWYVVDKLKNALLDDESVFSGYFSLFINCLLAILVWAWSFFLAILGLLFLYLSSGITIDKKSKKRSSLRIEQLPQKNSRQ